ncbi:FMN-binding protein [Propionicicella superfundia]|uniref:FMN-binding protein n=1 Tax=Propionicicella superfundia TaxID=348582 RepID=UPI00041AF687|nr:FMN-binding protein [Propionicicella superfundia]
MRRIVTAAMATLSGLVLLFSYHTSTNATPAQTTTGGSADADGGSAADTPATASVAPSATATSSASASGTGSQGTSATSGTFTGDAASTPYGDVQVRITVENGEITAAEAVEYPNQDHHDQQINAYAIPILNSEAVAAQSAGIDAVSGATITSDAYIRSLQSALDQAHL